MRNLLNPIWTLVISTLPKILLGLLYLREFHTIKSLLSEQNIHQWQIFGGILLVITVIEIGLTSYLIFKKRNLNTWLSLLSLVIHIALLYGYLTFMNDIFPFNVPNWILPDEIQFYPNVFLMPVIVHALFILVIHISFIKSKYSTLLNFLGAISIPLIWYLFVQVIFPLWKPFSSEYYMHIIIVLGVSGTVLFLFFLLKIIYSFLIKKDIKWIRIQLLWKIPIAFILPTLGLLINNGEFHGPANFIFGDYSNPWFYILVLINAIFLCLPDLPNHKYRLFIFLGRCTTLSFVFYFFMVFLPFLPLSIIAILFIGFGFLMLTPLILFMVQINAIHLDFKYLSQVFKSRILILSGVSCFLLIPLIMHFTFLKDRWDLHKALQYVYSPDYHKNYDISPGSLRRALSSIVVYKEENNDFIISRSQPFISTYYNWLVLDNLTLSDAKINQLGEVFLDEKLVREWPRSNNREEGSVVINGYEVSSHYHEKNQNWVSWVDLELKDQSKLAWSSEYKTVFELPNGCWISDYYLYVFDKKEYGILAEKKTAQWVYSQIVNRRKDPGLIHYLGGNKVSFRVFPFNNNEVRKTGIQFIHPEPVDIIIDGITFSLGDKLGSERPETTEIESVKLINKDEKEQLEKVQRKPYYHFIMDCSEKSKNKIGKYKSRLNDFFAANPLNAAHKISFVNSYVTTVDYQDDWDQTNEIEIEGGFFVDRAIRKSLIDHYLQASADYPVFIIISDRHDESLSISNFNDVQFTFPDAEIYYELWEDGKLKAHSLKHSSSTDISISQRISMSTKNTLAWPDTKNTKAYLPDDSQPSIYLSDVNIQMDRNVLQEKNWKSALYMEGIWRSHLLNPVVSEKGWVDLVEGSFISRIMNPYTSFIVVENEAQKAILKRKQEQVLAGNKNLDLTEDIQQMSEPGFLVLLLLLLPIYFLRKHKLNFLKF